MKPNSESVKDMLARMIKEGKKTMSEAKKSRVKKTKMGILRKSFDIQENKLLVGSLVRHHIQAHIKLQTCSKCRAEQKVVDFLHVWSQSPMESNSSNRMTSNILSRGMYDFHHDLPMTVHETKVEIPACAECVYIDAEIWAPLKEEDERQVYY